MKNQYRIEIGIRKGRGRVTLKEKIEVDESIMRELLDVLLIHKPMTITNIIKVLELAEDSSIEFIEIRED